MIFKTKAEAMSFIQKKIFPNTFEDGGDGGDGGAGDGGAGDGAGGAGGDKTFTQEQVNSMVANARKEQETAARKENQQLLSKVKMLETKATLTEEEKNEYQQTIDTLEKRAFTAEELKEQETQRLANEHQEAVESLTGERDLWRNRFTEATIHRSITDAAVQHEAFNTSQIVALLQPTTKLVEQRGENGEITGLVPEVSFSDTDKEGNPVTLALTPAKAVELMKEKKEFLNLFKGKHLGGLGGENADGDITPSLERATSNLGTYKKNRDKILSGEIK
jgi:hypothetical protein